MDFYKILKEKKQHIYLFLLLTLLAETLQDLSVHCLFTLIPTVSVQM